MSHSADFAFAPLVAVLARFHESLLPKGFTKSLTEFQGEHVFEAQAYYPPYDLVPRNISSWLGEKLTIGAESFDQTALGGGAESQEAFNPAVAQWMVGDEIGFLSVSRKSLACDIFEMLMIHSSTPPKRPCRSKSLLAR